MSSGPEPHPVRADEPELEALLRAAWPGLRAYIVSMLGPHRDRADDVLQETAIFVWENRAELPEVKNFTAWMFRAAYYKTLSCRRDLARSKESMIGDELFDWLAEAAAAESEALTELRLAALKLCLTAATEEERRLLDWRYRDRRPVVVIADALGQTVNTMNQRLSRLRRSLRNCVELRMSGAVRSVS